MFPTSCLFMIIHMHEKSDYIQGHLYYDDFPKVFYFYFEFFSNQIVIFSLLVTNVVIIFRDACLNEPHRNDPYDHVIAHELYGHLFHDFY